MCKATKAPTIFAYSEPKTEEQIATNLVYLMRENKEMKDFKAFKLGMTFDATKVDGVRWTFVEKILPKLNAYFLKLWEEGEQLKENNKEIKRLGNILKDTL